MTISVLDAYWADEDQWIVAILDGASIVELRQKMFEEHDLKHDCLFSGELEPDMAEVAPYLVRLEAGTRFTEWVISGWGGNWGIFAVVPSELNFSAVRRQLRKLNTIYGPDSQPLRFRWYDPRILRVALPIFDSKQLKELFGPVSRFITEGETPDHGLIFSLAKGELVQERFVVKD